MDIQEQQLPSEQEVRKPLSKEEIRERLHFYHGTTKEKWQVIQEQEAILSEAELLRRGLISKEDLEDFDVTSTGEMDRQIGNDKFVFLSTTDVNFAGELVLEIDPSILEAPGVIVNVAGDYLNFANDPDLERYYEQSQIPGSEFLDYLTRHINSLDNPEWFFGQADGGLSRLVTEGLAERFTTGNAEKFKLWCSLSPEVKIPNELPVPYVKNVVDHTSDVAP